MHINELIPSAILEQAIEDGLVARKVSPCGTKHLYCYTKQAQFRNEWNEATINARGLTTDAETGEILARPFPKFFNYGDSNAPEIDLDQRVLASDKLDGSLAVLQPDGTMTSKGSFTSDVAIAATKLYQEKYADKFKPIKDVTYCFEYTSPDNRIVLNYGAEPELTFIGAVDLSDGFILDTVTGLQNLWPGPSAEALAYHAPLREVLAMPPRENAEGMVLMWGASNVLKLKQADYLAMHRVVTNTSAITIWEALAVHDCVNAGADKKLLVKDLHLSPEKIDRALELGDNWLEEMSGNVPDEFHEWLEDTAEGIYEGDYQNALRHAKFRQSAQYLKRIHGIENPSRGEMARFLQKEYGGDSLPWNVSLDIWLNGGMLTHRSRAAIWNHVRPSGTDWSKSGVAA